MSTKKVLVVFGVTGNQGGSVVDSILKDASLSEQFEIRGITRDPTKSSAIALAEKGIILLKVSRDSAPFFSFFTKKEETILTREGRP